MSSPVPLPLPRDLKLPAMSFEEQYRWVWGLRLQPVTACVLDMDAPHLLLTFPGGRLLVVDGYHPRDEMWDAHAWYRDNRHPLVGSMGDCGLYIFGDAECIGDS
jgi:hypothetical protein